MTSDRKIDTIRGTTINRRGSALGEIVYPLQEERYIKELNDILFSYSSQIREGCLTGRDMQVIHYQLYLNDHPRGAMVICHDGCESSLRYTEWALFYHSKGFQVYLLDFSGHGRSDREIDNRSVTHIDSFKQYAHDLADLTSRIPRKLPLYITAFGMGGAVALQYLQNNPSRVKSACLFAPLIGIHLPEPRGLYQWKLRYHVGRGLSKELIPGSVCSQPGEMFDRNPNKSFQRFVWYKEQRSADSRLQNNSYTLGWLNAALKACNGIFTVKTKRVETKILLIEAGNDMVVPAEQYKKLLCYLKAGSHVRLANADHRMQDGNNAMLGDMMHLAETFFVSSKHY